MDKLHILMQSYYDWYVAVCEGVDLASYDKELPPEDAMRRPRSLVALILLVCVVIALVLNLATHLKGRRLRATRRYEQQHRKQVMRVFGTSKMLLSALVVITILCILPGLYVR